MYAAQAVHISTQHTDTCRLDSWNEASRDAHRHTPPINCWVLMPPPYFCKLGNVWRGFEMTELLLTDQLFVLTPHDIAKHQVYNRPCKPENFLLGTNLPLCLGLAKSSMRRFSSLSHLLENLIPSLLCGKGGFGGWG